MKKIKILFILSSLCIVISSTLVSNIAHAEKSSNIIGNEGKETYSYGKDDSNINCQGNTSFILENNKAIKSTAIVTCNVKDKLQDINCESMAENGKFTARCDILDPNKKHGDISGNYNGIDYSISTSTGISEKVFDPQEETYSGNVDGLTLFIDKNFIIREGRDMQIIDAKPFIKDGKTLVPVRLVSEGLGYEVKWNQEKLSVSIKKGTNQIELYLGSKEAFVNGKTVQLEVAPQIKDGSTMIPIRFVSETLGASVSWDQKNYSVQVK